MQATFFFLLQHNFPSLEGTVLSDRGKRVGTSPNEIVDTTLMRSLNLGALGLFRQAPNKNVLIESTRRQMVRVGIPGQTSDGSSVERAPSLFFFFFFFFNFLNLQKQNKKKFNLGDNAPVLHRPNINVSLLIARGKLLAVRRKGDGVHLSAMSLQHRDFLLNAR
jgi:hypothetical protein